MADRAISDLTSAEQITNSDLFLLEQGGTAKKLTGQVLIAFLTALADGHGGISGIQKTGTSGLVDTYRITLADGTTFDFTVTNGQKGDRGDNAYTWIKYASQEPTASSHSMGDLPDAWMGVYAGNAASAPTDWRQYKWFNIKGQKGNTGDPARIVSSSVTYQVGTNATDAPSGQWLPVVPETPQGAYLWSRIEIQFNSGDPIIVHSVARMGVDGVGTVNSVNGVTPDPTGNIAISATTVGALPRNGGTLQGPLNVNSHRITGLPTPTDDTDAVPYSMIKNVRELKWQNPDASSNFFGQTITISDPGKQYNFATINFLAVTQGMIIDQHMIMLDDIPLEDDYAVKRRVYDDTLYREVYISYVNGSWNFRFWGVKSTDSSAEFGSRLIPVEIYLIKHIMPTVRATALGDTPEDPSIPGYWQSALDDGVSAINTAVEAAGRNKSAFLWYTDAHWGYGSGVSPVLLKYLRENTAMNKINFGGDFANNYEYPDTGKTEDDWLKVMRDFRMAVRNLPNHHSVIGNHDYQGSDGTVDYLNGKPKHLYGFVMAPEETPNIVRGGDFYYYIDDPNEKTRYLYLDTSFCWDHNGTGEVGQGQFVTDALTSAPNGWHIVAISHIWFRYNDSSEPTVGTIPVYCQNLLDLFDKYNARGSGSASIGTETVEYNFTNKTGKVEFCIGGHTHMDYDFSSTDGIPVILTRTDSYHWRDGNVDLQSVPGTTEEASVSGVIADYDNAKVWIVRVGKGESREVALNGQNTPDGGGSGGETNYTNILKTVGYTKNTRLSASGGYTEKEQTGVDLTGFIPVKIGDVLRFKNITIPRTSASGYDNEIYTFDASKIGTASGDVTDFVGTGYWEAEWDGNENLSKLVYGAADGYCRINATNIDENSIITINEPIG